MKGNIIEINGELISVEGSISFEVYSPFTDASAKRLPSGSFVNPKGNYSQQFTSRDKKLDQLTGYAGKLQSKGVITEFANVRMLSNGIVIDKGRLIVDEVEIDLGTRDNVYKLIFFSDKGTWNKAVSGQKLTGLQMDGIRNINNPTLTPFVIPGMNLEAVPEPELFTTGTVSSPQPNDTIIRTICIEYLLAYLKNKSDVGYAGDALSFAIDQPEPGVMNLWVIADNGTPYVGSPSQWNIFAFFYVNPPTSYGTNPFSLSGITDWANAINAAYGTDDADPYICFPIYGTMDQSGATDSCLGFYNYTSGNDGDNTMPAYITQEFDNLNDPVVKFINYIPCRNQIVPMFYYHQVLRHCFAEFGFTLEGDILNDPNFQRLVLPNVYSILKEQVYQLANLNQGNVCLNALYCQLPTQLIPANHLPDMLITDFVSDFCLRFQCYIRFNGLTATIVRLNIQEVDESFNHVSDKISIIYPGDGAPGLNISYGTNSGDTSYAADTAKNLQNIIPPGPVNTPDTKSFNTFNDIPINVSWYKTPWQAYENKLTWGVIYIPMHRVQYLPDDQAYKTVDSGILLPVNVFEIPSHPVNDVTGNSQAIVAKIIAYYLAQIKKGNAQPDYFSALPYYRQQYMLQKDTGEIWTILNILNQSLPSLQLNWNYADIVAGITSTNPLVSTSLVIGSLSTAGSQNWPPQNLNNHMPYNTGSFDKATSNRYQQFQLALTPVEMFEFGKINTGTTPPFNVNANTFPNGYIGQSFNGTVYSNKPFPQLTALEAIWFLAGNVLTFCYQVVGGGIAVPAQLNINAYGNLGIPIYDTSQNFKGILGSNNAYGVVQYCQPKHAYVAYTGSKPSFCSLQVYIAAAIGLGSFISKSHDPAYTGPLSPGWPTDTYVGSSGSIFTCPCCINTPPPFNAGEIESKLALYYGPKFTMELDLYYMSFMNYAPIDPATAAGNLQPWNLSLVGTEGLINTYWGPLVNVWVKNRQVTISLPLTWAQIAAWDWTTAKVIRGVKYYVASIKFKLPELLNGVMAELECYEI